jgi:CheY-like chemotaxis protein
MIDLGLPDGNGIDLIAELTTTQPRVEVIMGMSADDHLGSDAIAAGADGFIAKPITSLAAFQSNVLALLPEGRRPKGPRVLDNTMIRPDRIAYRDDIAHIADVLDDSEDSHSLDYVAQFLTGVARSAKDPSLEKAALNLALKRALGQSAASETAVVAGMIQDRLAQKIAI